MAGKDTKSTGSDENKILYCSFCGKGQNEVRKLIAGPSDTYAMSVLIYAITSSRKS